MADHPYQVELEADKKYCWCTCGLTQTEPFCDGSHKQSSMGQKSLHFIPEKAGYAMLCGCKKTKTPPYCDDSHATL